jgi:hypothetical protein
VELEAQIGRMKRTTLSSKILRRRFEISSFLKTKNIPADPGGGGGAGGSNRMDKEDNAEFENIAETL